MTNENFMSVKCWGNEEDQEAIKSSYVPIPKVPLILGFIIVLEKYWHWLSYRPACKMCSNIS